MSFRTTERSSVCVAPALGRHGPPNSLLEQGRDAVNLEGGMLAWSAEGEPLEGDIDEPTII